MTEQLLSQQQIDDFHRDGYLLVRNLYSVEEAEEIGRWANEVAAMPEEAGSVWMYFDHDKKYADGRLLNRIENFIPFHQGFRELITRKRMQQAVSELFSDKAILFKEKINFKLPDGGGFAEHQDVQAGWDRYGKLHITAMISIDETNAANGSLEMIPGMHQQGVLGSMWAPLTDDDTKGVEYTAVHCQPGDAVFFDSYAPHRSAPNKTDKPRRVLYITYNAASDGDQRELYYADKHASYPPDVERDQSKDYAFKV